MLHHYLHRGVSTLLSLAIVITAGSQTVAVKNNLLYDATLTPNLGVEASVGKRSTV